MGQLLYNRWLKTAAKHPSAVAVTDSEEQVPTSFKKLQGQVDKHLLQLQHTGPVCNRIVAFQCSNHPSWMAIFLACQALDGIAMAIDPDIPPEAVSEIVSAVGATIVWTRSGLSRVAHGGRRNPACLIKLTSGTTGNPRPLFISDQQMLADGRNITKTMGITGLDSNLATIPFGHSYGLGNIIMPFVMKGCPIHICRDPFPHAIASVASKRNPSIYPTVPALIRSLVRSQVQVSDLNSIRLWISAGSVLNPQDANLFQQKFGSCLHNFYGSSETGGIAYDRTGKDTQSGRSVGKPLDGVHCLPASSGRLVVQSRAVFTRYNRRRHEQFGQYLLPDKASILPDGCIHLLGRGSRIEKIGGKRVSLAEIEKSLIQMKGVEACHVDIYRDSKDRTRLGAVIVSNLSIETLQAGLKAMLPPWKIPVRWKHADALPTNARGKLNREKIRQLIVKGSAAMEKR